jgi:hypothetical protein
MILRLAQVAVNRFVKGATFWFARDIPNIDDVNQSMAKPGD